MKRARKSKRVSWAPGFNLCQVKLFLSEDCPSKVSQTSQDLLQAKTSSILHSSTNESHDLPPGFEDNHISNHLRNELSHLYQIKWKTPPLFALCQNWLVAAGEESREKVDQKLREMKVLEAVYPRPSAIPPSPSVSLDVEEEDYDDNLTPLIPIVPIEEEELMDVKPELPATIDTSATLQTQSLHHSISATDRPICSQLSTSSTLASPGTSGVEADVAAASAVVAAIMNSNEQGSSIDMDLLVKILNDPLLIEKLRSVHDGAAATTASASANLVGLPISGVKCTSPSVSSFPLTPDKPTSGVSPSNIVGLFPDSGLMPVTPSVQLMHTVDKPGTATLPFSRPVPGKLGTPSAPLPSHTIAADIHKPVNKTTDHWSSGGLPSVSTQRSQQDTVKQAAPMASILSREPSTVPLSSTGVSMPAVVNQVRSPTTTMAYRPSTGPAFAGKEAHPVKDLSYYKNLIRQHGADDNNSRQETHDSQIAIRQTNFKDLKPVHNNKPGEGNYKTQKPCIYFKSSRGCRNGSNCPYQHDVSAQWGSVDILGSKNAKRAKLGPEIRGRVLI
ncbi:zinc finger CCCH domain-containing protein 6-like [Neltuma alba]|uniref:zinc finger CCCH domain-containing protein 6-like n=1 Tax=Neltuma alba TaxID=207710 RepID=UPI0010A3C1A1|nr:zinc finger CCCH domain-containing protein 6-like [Prosopis alba]